MVYDKDQVALRMHESVYQVAYRYDSEVMTFYYVTVDFYRPYYLRTMIYSIRGGNNYVTGDLTSDLTVECSVNNYHNTDWKTMATAAITMFVAGNPELVLVK